MSAVLCLSTVTRPLVLHQGQPTLLQTRLRTVRHNLMLSLSVRNVLCNKLMLIFISPETVEDNLKFNFKI